MQRMLGAFGFGALGFAILGGGKVLATKILEGVSTFEQSKQYRAALPDSISPEVAKIAKVSHDLSVDQNEMGAAMATVTLIKR